MPNFPPPDGWIGVDLDGTLAFYGGSIAKIGKPIPLMVDRVKEWLAKGIRVKIFTARVSPTNGVYEVENQRTMIAEWCSKVFGQILDITCQKDYGMIVLWDDRVIQVESNTGQEFSKRRFEEFQEAVCILRNLVGENGNYEIRRSDGQPFSSSGEIRMIENITAQINAFLPKDK